MFIILYTMEHFYLHVLSGLKAGTVQYGHWDMHKLIT